jgi:hypothetical protein
MGRVGEVIVRTWQLAGMHRFFFFLLLLFFFFDSFLYYFIIESLNLFFSEEQSPAWSFTRRWAQRKR